MSPKKQSQATDWAERPTFRQHQRLTPQRLNRLHDHQSTRLRHALLGLAGPGVVYGFAIKPEEDRECKVRHGCIHIGCGLAIDHYGRQLYWPGGWIGVHDLAGPKPKIEDDPTEAPYRESEPEQFQEPEKPIPEPPKDGVEYTLRVHYAEHRDEADEHCGCNRRGADWVREGVVFSVTKGCEPIQHECPDHRDKCLELHEYVCGRLGADDVGVDKDKYLPNLCEQPEKLCGVACDGWLYDSDGGVNLACVNLCKLEGHDKCHHEVGFCSEKPHVCAYRPFIYRNPLLLELIRGCHVDLPHVTELSFGHLLGDGFDKPVPWERFAKEVKKGFHVMFSKPIKKKTLHDASVFVTAVVGELESEFRDVLRFPVAQMVYLDEDGNDLSPDAPHAHGVRLRFSENWVNRQLHDRRSRFEFGATIEFTVRGTMLRDRCDLLLDARPLGYPKAQPGLSMMGDDFVAAFCVEAKPVGPYKAGDEESLRD